jgi:adenylate cyclase
MAAGQAPVPALRDGLFDLYQRFFPRERRSAPVVIVEIDERALARHGQWPWPRTLVAELISRIADRQPVAIGLDLLFPEPDRFSPAEVSRLLPQVPQELAERLQALPSNDARLAEAIEGRNVVLAVAGLGEVAPSGSPPLRQFTGLLASVPPLQEAAAGRGLISADAGDRVRRPPLVARAGQQIIPGLALELWRVAAGVPAFAIRDAGAGLLEVRFGEVTVPVQRDGSMWLRYSRHDPGRFASAADVLARAVDPQMIEGKLVLIGVTGLGLLDLKTTPFGEQVPGVELHAQLIEQIYDSTFLVRPAWVLWFELALLIGGAAVLVRVVPAARVGVSVVAFFAFLFISAGLGLAAFLQRGVLLDAAWPALGLAAVFAVLLAAALSEADRQRRELREAAARAAGELEAARRIQVGLLPDPGAVLEGERRFRLHALVQPARSVGGDFYDCFKPDARHLFFVVADVSGKGMPAALFMALCKTTIKAAVASAGADPGAALQRAAIEIGRDNPELFFVTVFAAVLDLETGALRYSNAGHEPPYLWRRHGGVERLAAATRPPIGVPETFAFATQSLELGPGDWICALTDGVTEAMNESGELYGVERLMHRLQALPADAGPAEVSAAVQEDVTRFVGEASPSDDLTLLIVRRDR